ncbi:MAG: transporter substrate-binding domain-containing protein [Agathobacter sp.]|nr:transporter substrate-binding domain-containing protein [Agathobacter sp.]
MKKIMALALALVMVLGTLTACGGGNAVSAKVITINLTEEQYAFGVDKNQPELLDDVNNFIKKIKEDGTFDEICDKYFGEGTPEAVVSAELDESKDQLVVATNAAFAPFEYTEDGGKTYLGVDMEIANLLAKELGKELVIQDMEFESVCTAVQLGKCDIAMAGLTINEDRKELVNFSDSYYNASQQVIVLSDNTEFDTCKTAADVEKILNGKDESYKVGVQKGTTGNWYVAGDEDWGFAGFPVKCVEMANGSLAVQDLLNGGLDCVIIDSAPAAKIVESFNAMN